MMYWIVSCLIPVALIFDYIYGFHDAANSFATVVSTRVLSPGKAVIWAAFFNFVAAFVFGTAVAKTVGSGMIDVKIVTFSVILGGLAGAIIWDLITWYFGLPTSSSHALVGGYAGAAVAKAGFAALVPGGWTKTIVFIFLSPLIGMFAGLLLMVAIQWIFRWTPPSRVDRWFRRLQLLSVGGFAADTGAALALMTATLIGVPVSTTHAITGSIVGVGATRRLSAVRWGVARQIVWAWVLTIPAAFTIAAVTYKLLALFVAS